MSVLVKGNNLPEHLKREVLNSYIYRWTHENSRSMCRGCQQVGFPAAKVYVCGQALPDGPTYFTEAQWHAYHKPLTTDAEWLADHAFYVTKAGKLDARRKHAEPAYLAD